MLDPSHLPLSGHVSALQQDVELWGGVECTVNRIGDRYLDQLARNGHAASQLDLHRFAELGFTALRFPLLWERTATTPEGNTYDWSWADERLKTMQALQLRPIAGLIHHGSGPPSTNLLDPAFPARLAAYAREVADRYPWLGDYTPVNEPLTTARFSGLYGHWYPHKSDDFSFCRALLNQIKGVVLAMRAIREVNPSARLIQTEDLGKVYSTPLLSYQAEFENCRRWSTFDLLLGRVCRDHPLWVYFTRVGVQPDELQWFADNPCPPDVLGLNYYVVGERLLDERRSRYPDHGPSSNGRHTYTDVAAVRALHPGIAGAELLLGEVWARYRLPMAVTEAHLCCTREEQLRWVMEIWNAARTLREGGADVRAVTLWALLGAFDWNCLLTREAGHYESGVFDLRAPQPRPTALAHLAKSLSEHGDFQHPVLATPGWWRRDQRLLYRATEAAQGMADRSHLVERWQPPILITGGRGTLAQAFARICQLRGLSYRLLDRQHVDIASATSVRRALRQFRPWAVVNAAGYVRVDDAEDEPVLCWRENVTGVETLAKACQQQGNIPLVTFSSDLVFDGRTSTAYVEGSLPEPLNQYGRSKRAAEHSALSSHPAALVIRTSAFFGPWDEANFVCAAVRALAARREFVAVDDETVSPTYVPDLVNAALDLLIDGEHGIWHLANAGAVTWAELAAAAAEEAGIEATTLHSCPASSLRRPAARPSYSVLTSERASVMRPWREALGALFQDSTVDILSGVESEREEPTLAPKAA